MIVGSGQFSDGYGNARVHKYSPDGAARIGVQAGHPNLSRPRHGRDQFPYLSDRNRRAGAEREKDIACGVPLRVPLDFIP
jgi:hypothetical protein